MPRAKKPKKVTRDWFVADIAVGDGHAVLDPKRGSKRVIVELLADCVVEHMTPEPMRVLRANIGDHLVLLGPALEELADATVMKIEPRDRTERLHVALGYGLLHRTTTSVHVLKGRRAA